MFRNLLITAAVALTVALADFPARAPALAGHYHTFEEVHWKSNEHDTRFVVVGSICGEWWKGDHRRGRSSWPEGFRIIEVYGDKFAASYVPYGWKGTEEQ